MQKKKRIVSTTDISFRKAQRKIEEVLQGCEDDVKSVGSEALTRLYMRTKEGQHNKEYYFVQGFEQGVKLARAVLGERNGTTD